MGVRLSSGVDVLGLYGVVLSSNRANIATKSQADLIEENKNPIQSYIKATPNDNNSSFNPTNSIKVAFEDERSSRLVVLNLSVSNVLNLVKNFGKDDFFVRSDGILRLNGKVQNFVSGWFEKAAYEMNLLAADTDKNGLVEGKELAQTFVYREPYAYANAKNPASTTAYTLAGGEIVPYDENGLSKSIEDVLNAFFRYDKNSDNKITFIEHFGSEKKALAKIEVQLYQSQVAGFDIFKFILDELEKLQEELQEEFKESKDELKERAMRQGLQVLSEAELERFKSENPLEYERLKNSQGAQDLSFDKTRGENSALNLNASKRLANSGQNSKTQSSLDGDNAISQTQKKDENNALQTQAHTQTDDELNLLLNAMSKDLLAQVRRQGVKIVDLKA